MLTIRYSKPGTVPPAPGSTPGPGTAGPHPSPTCPRSAGATRGRPGWSATWCPLSAGCARHTCRAGWACAPRRCMPPSWTSGWRPGCPWTGSGAAARHAAQWRGTGRMRAHGPGGRGRPTTNPSMSGWPPAPPARLAPPGLSPAGQSWTWGWSPAGSRATVHTARRTGTAGGCPTCGGGIRIRGDP